MKSMGGRRCGVPILACSHGFPPTRGRWGRFALLLFKPCIRSELTEETRSSLFALFAPVRGLLLLDRTRERFLLFGDLRTMSDHFRVQGDVLTPFFGDVVFVVNRPDGALGDARLAVDAMVRVDVQHLLPF